jgi:hypothetical protein
MPAPPSGQWVLLEFEEDVMVASVSRLVMQNGTVWRLWWLPAGGLGNGLDDDAWAPVLEISERLVPRVLSSLRSSGVPAYAALAHPAAVRSRSKGKSAVPPGYQLWVGAYGEAETALLALMPSLARETADQADAAWR